MKGDTPSFIWYFIILVVAFFVSLYQLNDLNDKIALRFFEDKSNDF